MLDSTNAHELQSDRPLTTRLREWWNRNDVDIDIRRWTAVAAVVLIFSGLFREPLLALIALGIALAGLTGRIWWDHCLRGLTITRTFSEPRVFCGEDVEMTITAVNAKPLPLTRIDFSDQVSRWISVNGRPLERSDQPHRQLFRSLFSLGFYERVSYRYQIEANHRGWHQFGPAVLRVNDPFGMVMRRSAVEGTSGYLMYPRVVPVNQMIVPIRQPYGEQTPPQSFIEDPMRIAGVRPYVAGDSPRHIHWRATARTGELQTRVHEPSATTVTAIFLDTITFAHLWEGQNSQLLELAIMTTASMSAQVLEGKHQLGLYVNAPIPGQSRTVRVPPSRGAGQMSRVLENLAMISPAYGEKIEQVISRELPKLPWGASAVIVTCRVTESLQRTLLRASRVSGSQRFVLVVIGEEAALLPELRRRVAVYRMGAEEAWDEIQQITLTRHV